MELFQLKFTRKFQFWMKSGYVSLTYEIKNKYPFQISAKNEFKNEKFMSVVSTLNTLSSRLIQKIFEITL